MKLLLPLAVATASLVHADSALWKQELKKWDDVVLNSCIQTNRDYFEQTRLYTYLYVAQDQVRELAGSKPVSFAPISELIIKEFCPDYTRPQKVSSDRESVNLANQVFKKLKYRINQENNRFDLRKSPDDIANWLPWLIKDPKRFWPKAPPPITSDFWKEQAADIIEDQTPMTREKLGALRYWAHTSGKNAGHWTEILNRYIDAVPVSMAKATKARATYEVALYDAFIIFMGAKYHYDIPRPSRYDPQIKTYAPIPDNPSYPSGHATIGALSGALLGHFFPNAAAHFEELGLQEGLSRLWAGGHYPIDVEAGRELGHEIANAIIQAAHSQDD